jgi:hypothetical protein
VTSRLAPNFRRAFAQLPARIKQEARAAYRQFQDNPQHPSLRFKKLPPHDDIWSVRITESYRAVGHRTGETIIWFFIGTHAEYDALLERL